MNSKLPGAVFFSQIVLPFLLLTQGCGRADGQVLFFDNFDQFSNGTALTSTNYVPASGPASASVATSVQNGSPTIKATNFLGRTWALFDNSVVFNKNQYTGFLSSVQTNQALRVTWKMWIRATNTGPGLFLFSIPTDDPLANFNPPVAFMDTGAIIAFTNGTTVQTPIGHWGSLAGTVMTNTLVLDYPNRALSYSLNGQSLATLPLGPYFTNVVGAIYFNGSERTAGSSGNRFAIDDVKVEPAPASPQFLWARRVASTVDPDDELSIGMTLDSQDNCYVTGWFDGTNDFGGVTLANEDGGGQDIFVAKYNASGALQWAQRAGGGSADRDAGRGIGVDTNGNVYIAGGYYGPANFGDIDLPDSFSQNFFLAKYDSAGTVQWVQPGVGSQDVYSTGLAVDGAGNAYALVFANNGDTITFGAASVTTPNDFDANFDASMILVKYDNSGTVQWTRVMGGYGETYATKVAVDSAGNVYVRGGFNTTLTIATTNLMVSPDSTKNMFIAKFNNAGALLWVRQPAGGNVGEGGVAVDPAGNVYVSGWYESSLNFGGITLTNAGAFDAFVARYSSSGTIQWARQAGGGTNNGAIFGFYWDVALDAMTNVYAVGFLGSGATVAKYDAAGTLQWTYSASSPPASPVGSVAAKCSVDAAGRCYLAGWYQGTPTFGASLLQPQGYWNYFLAEVGPPTTGCQPAIPIADFNFGVRSNQFGFNITAACDLVVVVDATTTLANPSWTPLATNTLAGVGAYFSDPDWTNYPKRFYRLRAP